MYIVQLVQPYGVVSVLTAFYFTQFCALDQSRERRSGTSYIAHCPQCAVFEDC